jgi:hypothetical protein
MNDSKNSIPNKIRGLVHDLSWLIEKTNHSILAEVSSGNYGRVRKHVEVAEHAKVDLSKLEEIACRWSIPAHTRHRFSAGAKTPQKEYYGPILRAVEELGGKALPCEVLAKVGDALQVKFTPVDLARLPHKNETRWKNTARWARSVLVNEGLMVDRRGVWELTGMARKQPQPVPVAVSA